MPYPAITPFPEQLGLLRFVSLNGEPPIMVTALYSPVGMQKNGYVTIKSLSEVVETQSEAREKNKPITLSRHRSDPYLRTTLIDRVRDEQHVENREGLPPLMEGPSGVVYVDKCQDRRTIPIHSIVDVPNLSVTFRLAEESLLRSSRLWPRQSYVLRNERHKADKGAMRIPSKRATHVVCEDVSLCVLPEGTLTAVVGFSTRTMSFDPLGPDRYAQLGGQNGVRRVDRQVFCATFVPQLKNNPAPGG